MGPGNGNRPLLDMDRGDIAEGNGDECHVQICPCSPGQAVEACRHTLALVGGFRGIPGLGRAAADDGAGIREGLARPAAAGGE